MHICQMLGKENFTYHPVFVWIPGKIIPSAQIWIRDELMATQVSYMMISNP